MADSRKDLYSLTFDAKIDIDEIFDYGEGRFGLDQALEYFLGLESLFEQLTTFPFEGILRDDIGHNIRSIPFGSHLVFYSVTKNAILIIRVLHQSQNVKDYFE